MVWPRTRHNLSILQTQSNLADIRASSRRAETAGQCHRRELIPNPDDPDHERHETVLDHLQRMTPADNKSANGTIVSTGLTTFIMPSLLVLNINVVTVNSNNSLVRGSRQMPW